MTALVEQIFGRLLDLPNLHQLAIIVVMLSKMTAEPTLSTMDVDHDEHLRLWEVPGLASVAPMNRVT